MRLFDPESNSEALTSLEIERAILQTNPANYWMNPLF